jgi:hypothetical protein
MNASIKNVQVDNADVEHINKFIRCPECGEQIQMVPALADMIAIIEDHMSIHKDHSNTDLLSNNIDKPCINRKLTEPDMLQAEITRDIPKDVSWIKIE